MWLNVIQLDDFSDSLEVVENGEQLDPLLAGQKALFFPYAGTVNDEANSKTAMVNLTVKIEFSDVEKIKKAAIARLESMTIEPEQEKQKEIEAAASDLKAALYTLLDPFDLSHDLDLVEITEASTEIILEEE